MANNNEEKDPDNADSIGPHDGIAMDAEARAYLNELRAEDDAARCDSADDGKCIDREFRIDPADDLPDMDIIMSNIHDM